MKNVIRRYVATGMGIVLSFGLLSCSAGASGDASGASGTSVSQASASQSGASSGASESGSDTAASVEEARSILQNALQKDYGSVTYSIESETSAIGRSDGEVQKQSLKTTMKGELDRSQDAVAMHMAYSSTSTAQPGGTSYNLYIRGDEMVVESDGKLYAGFDGEQDAKSFVDTVENAISESEVNTLLGIASSCRVEERDGGAVVSVTADSSKIVESGLVDENALPEGASIATLVGSYTIDAEGRFSTVQLLGSSSGTPTYRVSQTYRYSKYDATEVPGMPDLAAYGYGQMGLLTDENGNLYYVDENGNTLYVDHIDDDGTVYFRGDGIGDGSGAGGGTGGVVIGGGSGGRTVRQVQPGGSGGDAGAGAGGDADAGAGADPGTPASTGQGSATFNEGDNATGNASGGGGASFNEGDSSQTGKQQGPSPSFNEGDNTGATKNSKKKK